MINSMDDHANDSDLMGGAEDVCEICGAHVGWGVRLFHLQRCDEHRPIEEDYLEEEIVNTSPHIN